MRTRLASLRLCVWTGLALLCGCRGDVAVSPPEQRVPYQPEPLGSFVRMNQTDAERHFISGIYQLEENAWRWAGGKAVLRFHLDKTENLKYVMKFAVPREVLARSKSVRLRVLINGREFEKLQYQQQGIYDMDKPVPAAFLRPQADNIVTIEVDKPVLDDSRVPELGSILVHAGFQPQAPEQ